MLYHKEIYWKPSFDNIFRASWYGVKYIDFTQHMQERLKEKHINYRTAKLALNRIIYGGKGEIFEVETDKEGNPFKFSVRTEYDKNRDITFVFLRKNKKFIIKTIWLNYKTDRHDNLDFNKYERGYRQCN